MMLWCGSAITGDRIRNDLFQASLALQFEVDVPALGIGFAISACDGSSRGVPLGLSPQMIGPGAENTLSMLVDLDQVWTHPPDELFQPAVILVAERVPPGRYFRLHMVGY